jgi:hypothetical protein
MARKKIKIGLTLDAVLYEKLKARAVEDKRTIGATMELAILAYLTTNPR